MARWKRPSRARRPNTNDVRRWRIHLSAAAAIQLYAEDVDELVQTHLDAAARSHSSHSFRQVVGRGRDSVWFVSFPSLQHVYIATEGELADARLGADQIRELWRR